LRAIHTSSAPTPEIKNIERQPTSGIRKKPVKRRNEQRGIGDERKQRRITAAIARRREFDQRRIADHDLRAESDTHDEAKQDQPVHRGGEAAGDRCEPEHQQVRLIGKAPPEAVAEQARERAADRHADKRARNEIAVERQVRHAVVYERTQHGAGQRDIEAVEEHAGRDQPQHAAVKRADGQCVETRADGCR
jgi:hypothetical protein